MRRTCAQTANGTMLSQTVEDGFGRTIEESVPSPAGNLITTRSEYNERGQLIRRTRTDGSTEQAPTLYEYDHAGRISRQITALNGTPTPENSSIVEYAYSAEPADDGLVYAVTRTTRYNAAGEALTSEEKTLISALDPVLESARISIDERGNATATRTEYAGGNQTLIKTSTGTWNVTYNAKNRPIRFVKSDNSVTVECTYKAPEGLKGDWTNTQCLPRRGERPMRWARINTMGRRATKKVTTNGTLTEHRRFLYRGYLQIDSPPPHRRLTPAGQSRFAHCPTGLTAVVRLACCDLTRAYTPALWFITWESPRRLGGGLDKHEVFAPKGRAGNGVPASQPTQDTATRPLAIQKNGTWYTYGWDLTKNICETYRTDARIDLAYTYTPYGECTPAHAYDQPLRWSTMLT